jgi:SnoaL-like domain
MRNPLSAVSASPFTSRGPVSTNSPIPRWHAIAQSQDPSGLDDLLADDAVFISPVVHTPQRGKAVTKAYLSAAFVVLFNPSFRYVREIVGPNDAVLEFETEMDGITVNGVDLIKWNADGKITEFKVMVRPLKAMALVQARMAEMLASAKSPG